MGTPADRSTIKCNSAARQSEATRANCCCWGRLLRVMCWRFDPAGGHGLLVHLFSVQRHVTDSHGGRMMNVFGVTDRLRGDITVLVGTHGLLVFSLVGIKCGKSWFFGFEKNYVQISLNTFRNMQQKIHIYISLLLRSKTLISCLKGFNLYPGD